MKMSLKNILLGLCFSCFCLFATGIKAQDTCVYLFSIPQQANFATADHLNNTYLLHGFEVEKYDSTGRFVARFSNNRLGMPSFIDASTPLKILVWYADYQTAVFLDRNMTELGRLNVAQAGWPSVSTLAMATDGNLWMYDIASFKLMKINHLGEKITESEPLSFLEKPDLEITVSKIRENGERVFAGFKGIGILSFDIFGQNASLPLSNPLVAQFDIAGSTLITIDQDILETSEMGTFKAKKLPLPEAITNTGAFWLAQKRLFVLTPSGVMVWRISG